METRRNLESRLGGDIVANKKTFLLIKAQELAKGKVKDELESWLSSKNFKTKEKVAAVTRIYDSLGVHQLADKKIDQYFKKGFAKLNALSCSPKRSAELRQFAEALMGRQS